MFSSSTFLILDLEQSAPQFPFSFGSKNCLTHPAIHFFTQNITPAESCNSKNGTVFASAEFCNTENGTVFASAEFRNTKNGTVFASEESCNTENGAVFAPAESCNTENGTVFASAESCNTKNGTVFAPVSYRKVKNGHQNTSKAFFLTNYFTLNNTFYVWN